MLNPSHRDSDQAVLSEALPDPVPRYAILDKNGLNHEGEDARMDHAHPQPTDDDAGTEIVTIDASFEPLIPRFMTNRKKEVVTMQEALAAKDFETVRKVAHGMKGAGGSYGFDRISEMAAAIEQAAKAGNSSSIEHDLSVLDSDLDRIKVVYE